MNGEAKEVATIVVESLYLALYLKPHLFVAFHDTL
jgi:hypothetical protein